MSFEDKIPEHIKTVEENIKKLYQKKAALDWGDEGHECDCEFCDRQGEGETPPARGVEKKAKEIDEEIKAAEHTITSLKAHAAVYKVRIGVEKVAKLKEITKEVI